MTFVINRAPYNPRFKQRMRMKAMVRHHGSKCAYCKEETTKEFGWLHKRAPSRDHIIPLSRGGPDSYENLTVSCRECNELKGSLTADEFIAWRDGRASRLDWIKKPRRHQPYYVWDEIEQQWKPNPLNATVLDPKR